MNILALLPLLLAITAAFATQVIHERLETHHAKGFFIRVAVGAVVYAITYFTIVGIKAV